MIEGYGNQGIRCLGHPGYLSDIERGNRPVKMTGIGRRILNELERMGVCLDTNTLNVNGRSLETLIGAL